MLRWVVAVGVLVGSCYAVVLGINAVAGGVIPPDALVAVTVLLACGLLAAAELSTL